MMKLLTEVECGRAPFSVSYDSKVLFLGSCFSENVGSRMSALGFTTMVNPFGPLYNPESISAAVQRLADPLPFEEDECVQMGAGSPLWCSFSHYTRFARPTRELFLEDANAALTSAAAFWRSADTLVITLGTAYAFRHKERGEWVANCLKRPAAEFERTLLSIDQCADALERVLRLSEGKRVIFTVSPIRHFADGAHGNQISKSTLLLASDKAMAGHSGKAAYFPSYEIMMDELRDYRFYAEDMKHPTAQAVGHIWDKFSSWCIPDSERSRMEQEEKRALAAAHVSHL